MDRVRCAAHDSPRSHAHAARSAAGHRSDVRAVGGEDPRRSTTAWSSDGAPVFTVDGRYTARGWTEWTQGFQSRRRRCCSSTRPATASSSSSAGRARVERMAPHLTHVGVHDHGFNNVSTYGALWRLAREGRIDADPWESRFYELALKVSGAVQARRWTPLPGGGFIHSFNGAHSLFVDTIRSLRALALSHRLGHRLSEEQDAQVSLLDRLVQHARATARVQRLLRQRPRHLRRARPRRARERCSTPPTAPIADRTASRATRRSRTWTRGLAWAMLGFAEQLEFLETRRRCERSPANARAAVDAWMLEAARATCDFYIDHAACADGVPYWDTGAPGLAALGDWAERDADPFNDHEPVDSSAAAIAAQGLVAPRPPARSPAARTAIATRRPVCACSTRCSIRPARISVSRADHQGLILHAVYHRPNGWDHVPGRLADSARRVLPVGRLSRARSGALREAAGDRRAVSHVLRTGDARG